MLRTLTRASVLVLYALPVAALPPSDQAQVTTTRLVPVSGVLVDQAGAPLSGTQSVTFLLFDAEADGALLWTELQTVTADARGQYTAHLGSTVSLPLEIFRTEQARWLEVSVSGHALPRVMLVAVPYALKAADADSLAGRPANAFVTAGENGKLQRLDGTSLSGTAADGTGVTYQLAKWIGSTTLSSSIITESPFNQIGIGTTDPTEGGAIDSKVTIRTNDGSTALAVSNQAGTPRFALNVNGDGSWITYDRATGSFMPGIAQRGGRVGVSTTDPTGGGVVDAKFTVRNLDNNTGIAVLNESNARRFALNTLATGGWQLYDGYSNAWNPGMVQRAGRIGVGTSTPSASIEGIGGVYGVWGGTNTSGGFGVVGDSSTNATAVLGESTNGIGVWAWSQTGTALRVESVTGTAAYFVTGNVGIGVSSPADKLQVAGDIRVGTGTTGCVRDADATVIAGICSSDLQFKKNVTPFGRSLDAVTRLQPVYFDWRADEFPSRHFGATRSFGLIAQDVERALPELVSIDADGYKVVKYNALPFHMLQAIKDLKAENDSLKQQLQAQEDRLRRLEALVAK